MSMVGRTPERGESAATVVDDTVDLGTVLRILRRQWWLVALIAALFLGLGVTYAVLTPKTWRTSTRVMLDPRDKQLVGNDVARPQQSVELGWVETRLELVKSFSNLADVVKKEKLLDDPEIMGKGPQSDVPDERVSVAVRALADMILVERPKENNLLDVTVTSRSPEKAARLSQAVAEAFVAGLAQAKVDQVEQAYALLTRQADAQRKSMLDAEAKVEDYKRANGITVTRGNLLDEETMRQSNENLVSAHVKTQEAKERWDRLRQVLKSGDPAFQSQLDSVGSAVIGRLKIEAVQAARKKTEIEQEYGPLHPKARAAAADAERNKSLLLAEVASLAATAELDYQLAKSNEDNIRKNLDRAQSRLADTNQATIGLQDLVNEANARRDLYKSFVSRVQEMLLLKSTQVSDATIVSPAQVPLRPFAPRVGLALMLSLVAGLGIGVSAALYRGRAAMLRAWRGAPSTEAEAVVAAAKVSTAAEAAGTPEPSGAPEPVASVVAVPPARTAEPAAAAPAAVVAAEVEPVPHDASPPASDPTVEAPPHDTAAGAAEAPSIVRVDGAETFAATATPVPSRTPLRVDLTLLPERIARIGAPPGPGTGAAAALVETPEGVADYNGLAMLRRLADELGHGTDNGIRVVFSSDVPDLLTAAIAHGLARAAREAERRVLLLDLAAGSTVLDAVFEAASTVPRPNRRRANAAFDLRLDDHGVVLVRPRHAPPDDDPAHRADRLAEFLNAAARDHDDVVVHLGHAPAAALLFDVAETADHMVMLVDETEVATRRVQGEIEVMTDLMPHFDGIVVLRVADTVATAPREERRRRRRA